MLCLEGSLSKVGEYNGYNRSGINVLNMMGGWNMRVIAAIVHNRCFLSQILRYNLTMKVLR